ncbi:MAG TPA: hypothetical protein VGQ46_15445 [Thermoanaerobaculia bacterium]|jgi:predicted RNA-binding Zn-ribbon protein involved in translation (DUF1610 family)|nr:hypothetical protein [Thermoanaerobaculia bacterium]
MSATDFDKCADCDHEIVPEPLGADRVPCPECGSTRRQIYFEATLSAKVTVTADLTAVTYPQALLEYAKALTAGDRPEIAVVVAHMAAEIAAERTFTEVFRQQNLEHLEEAVTEFFQSCNLANDRVRRLYVAMSGDRIEQAPFWGDFKTSSLRRNKIVHGGERCSVDAANESVAAVTALVEHLRR